MPIIFSLLLTALVNPAAPLVHIDIAFTGLPVPVRVQDTAIQEVTAIWAPYHVELRASTVDDAGSHDALRLIVVLAGDHDKHLSAFSLGSIRFRGDQPEPVILMYPHTIDAIVSATPQSRPHGDCFPALHEIMVGRALGRALAHEIGHFLLRSRGHAAGGLMRATHRSPDLVANERDAFTLSDSEQARIRDVIESSADECVAGVAEGQH